MFFYPFEDKFCQNAQNYCLAHVLFHCPGRSAFAPAFGLNGRVSCPTKEPGVTVRVHDVGHSITLRGLILPCRVSCQPHGQGGHSWASKKHSDSAFIVEILEIVGSSTIDKIFNTYEQIT